MLTFVWTSLRTVFFASVASESQFEIRGRIFMWTFPNLIQLITFSLLVVFYAFSVHKSDWERIHRKRFFIGAATMNILYACLFFGTSHPTALSQPQLGLASSAPSTSPATSSPRPCRFSALHSALSRAAFSSHSPSCCPSLGLNSIRTSVRRMRQSPAPL
jgi:hypothetical protein